MHKTLQKLLIVTTALTFSCNSFSASAMLKGGKNEKNEISKTEMIKKYEELYEQLEIEKKQLEEAVRNKDITEIVANVLTNDNELRRIFKCSQEESESRKEIAEACRKKAAELTAKLQEHKDLMNKLNIPIPIIITEEGEKNIIKECRELYRQLEMNKNELENAKNKKSFEEAVLKNKLEYMENIACSLGDEYKKIGNIQSKLRETEKTSKDKDIAKHEEIIRECRTEIDKTGEECEQLKGYICECNRIVKDCKKKADKLTDKLQGHKNKMNKFNIPIPDMDEEEIRKDKKIKKNTK